MICSNSAVLSGLMATVRIAVSPSKVSAWPCARTPPWPCENAGSNMIAPASSNPDTRRIVSLAFTLRRGLAEPGEQRRIIYRTVERMKTAITS